MCCLQGPIHVKFSSEPLVLVLLSISCTEEVTHALSFQRKYPMHYKIALIINYLGHCISVGALVVAFVLFLCLRQVQK